MGLQYIVAAADDCGGGGGGRQQRRQQGGGQRWRRRMTAEAMEDDGGVYLSNYLERNKGLVAASQLGGGRGGSGTMMARYS